MLDALLVATGVFTQREVGAADRDTDVAIAHSLPFREGLRQETFPILGSHTQQVVAGGAGQSRSETIHRLESLRRVKRNGQWLLRIRLAKRYVLLSEVSSAIGCRHESSHRLRAVHLVEIIRAELTYVIQQDFMRRIRHRAMIVAIQLIEVTRRMTHHLHHTPEVGGLLITT